MEDYRLTQSGQEVQNILDGAAMQVDLTAETERATEAEQTLQGNIDAEATRAQGAEGTLQDNIDAEEARAKASEKQNADDIDAIEEKIPSGASSSNKLATEEYVADAVATATATFRGTYNLVSDLHLNVTATEQQIAAALAGAISTADNNDYCFILVPTSSETPTEIKEIDRYKFNGTAWGFEYKLNNSGFTAAQWAAINSGITSGDVTKLAALPTNAQLTTLLAGLQSDIDGEEDRAKGAEGTLQDNIDAEEARAKAAEKQNADDIDSIEAVLPETASSENKVATESEINSLSAAIEAILLLIPSAATSLNKLADKAFVNSSIATATATFRGTYNLVDDLGLTTSATHAQIATALAGAILTADNNDYAFVQIPTSDAMPTEIAKTERYKFNGTAWEYEYDLNNSGFTAAQWAAINSGITQALVTKLAALPTNAQLTTELGTLTSGITTINQKIPNAASQANKLVDTAAMESYIVEVLNVLTISYNVTSTDGHVTLSIEQVDGKITSVTLTTSDIASAAALNLKASQADLTALASRVTTAEGNITSLGGRMTTAESNITSLGGRMTTAEGNITSLGGRVSTNENDIANLQQLYSDLQQSKPVPVTALPSTGQQQGVIYRLAGTTSYSDYMWNGSTWVLMATYNNAIDPRPKKGSTNLVESGGVFDNMGALDVSELNATENPHTLATYADLSAALAAIPTDYQKGGMSIKFVQSSDNKYVQYRFMLSEFTAAQFANTANWQGVDDEPTFGGKNLVDSNGIYNYDKSIVRSKFDGAGLDTHVTGNVIRDLLPGHKYRVWVKDTNPDFTGMNAGFKISIGADSSFSHLLASTDYRFTLKEYYDVVMPDGYSEMYIGGRRKVGDTCVTYIQDITYSTEIENLFEKWVCNTADFKYDESITNSVSYPAGTTVRIKNNAGSNVGIEFRVTAGSGTGAQSVTVAANDTTEIKLRNNCVQIYFVSAHDVTIDFYGIFGNRIAETSILTKLYKCETAAATSAKTVNGLSNFTFNNTGSIKIKFTNANTASSVTLNLSSTGAKPLLYNNEPVSASNTWKAGEVVEVYYDPTYNSNTGGFFAMEFLANKKLPEITSTSADYEISDEEGNVILRLKDGNIRTKNFNSQNIGDNPFFGKSIVWYGTSIPATGYPQICGSYIGATVHNEAVGGSCCRMGYISRVVNPDDPRGDKYGITGLSWTIPCTCLSMKQEEKHDLFVNWTTARRRANLKAQYGYTDEEVANVLGWGELLTGNPPADIMASDYDNYRKMSYGLSYNTYNNVEAGLGTIQGKVDKYLNANNFPDLWVFDHGHNDNSAEIETIPTPDNDRRYFIGAMNYIIEHILSYNPRARFIFIGHYENDDAGGSWNHANLCKAQQVLADYWNAPLYESWKMFDLSRSRVITTNAYWDNNGEWHQSGFDGTNAKSGTASNPRQVDGVWVHDMSLVQVHMLDGLHPEQTEIKTFIGHSLAKYIYSLIINF